MIRTLLLLALGWAAAPAAAQARYLPQPDTLYYEALNPYRMYFLVDGDTVGDPVRSLNVERHVWRQSVAGAGDGRAGGEPARRGDRHPAGRDRPPRPVGLRAPLSRRRRLRPGRLWHDTLGSTGGPGGENALQARRKLRVERIADTLGGRVAIVRGTGTLRYRDSYPSAGGKEWWIDVSGPMRETFLFDLTHGRMAGREWWMDLRGTAAFPNRAGGMDTLPAGLFSTDTTRIIDAEQAREMLPGAPPGLGLPRAQRNAGGLPWRAEPIAPRASAAGPRAPKAGLRRAGPREPRDGMRLPPPDRPSTQPSSGCPLGDTGGADSPLLL